MLDEENPACYRVTVVVETEVKSLQHFGKVIHGELQVDGKKSQFRTLTLVEQDVGTRVIVEKPHAGMGGVVCTHVHHPYVFVVFGSRDEVRFHFQGVGSRRETVADINAAVIIGLLCGNLRFPGHHVPKRAFSLFSALWRFQFKKPFFHVFQIPEQPFLGYVVHLREGIVQSLFLGNAFLYFADKGRQYAGVERRKHAGRHLGMVGDFFHLHSVVSQVFYAFVNLKKFVHCTFYIVLPTAK